MDTTFNLKSVEKKLEAEISKLQLDLEAVRRTLEITQRLGGSFETPLPVVVQKPLAFYGGGESTPPKKVVKSLEEAMSEAVLPLEGEFTSGDVEERLKAEGHAFVRSTVRTALKKMEERGMVQVVTPGQGRRATIYKKLFM